MRMRQQRRTPWPWKTVCSTCSCRHLKTDCVKTQGRAAKPAADAKNLLAPRERGSQMHRRMQCARHRHTVALPRTRTEQTLGCWVHHPIPGSTGLASTPSAAQAPNRPTPGRPTPSLASRSSVVSRRRFAATRSSLFPHGSSVGAVHSSGPSRPSSRNEGVVADKQANGLHSDGGLMAASPGSACKAAPTLTSRLALKHPEGEARC